MSGFQRWHLGCLFAALEMRFHDSVPGVALTRNCRARAGEGQGHWRHGWQPHLVAAGGEAEGRRGVAGWHCGGVRHGSHVVHAAITAAHTQGSLQAGLGGDSQPCQQG